MTNRNKKPTKKTATFIRDLEGFTGEARLYKVSPMMKDNHGERTKFVVVSATVAFMCGPETFIFPADESGEVTNWGEMNGSFQGGLDHNMALKGAGYTVKVPK